MNATIREFIGMRAYACARVCAYSFWKFSKFANVIIDVLNVFGVSFARELSPFTHIQRRPILKQFILQSSQLVKFNIFVAPPLPTLSQVRRHFTNRLLING